MTSSTASIIALALVTALSSASVVAQPGTVEPGASPQASARSKPAPPGDGVSPDIFYRVLLGDVALQRGEPALASRAYLDAARETRDATLARRAAEIALTARQRALAEQASRLWLEIDPTAERPKQILAALAGGTAGRLQQDGNDGELRTRLERFLADASLAGGGVGESFLQLNRVFAQHSDKHSVYRLVVELSAPYPTSAEAQLAVALAGLNTGLTDATLAKEAMAAVDRALALKPDWDRAVLLKAELTAKRSGAEAVRYLEAQLRKAPESRPLRGALAQFLTEQKRFGEARELYRKLLDADRTQRDVLFGIAVLSVQMKDWASAEADLAELKQAGFGDAGQVEFYLAQVSEERGRLDEAVARYKDVPDGERGWLAKLRIAAVMGKQGKRTEARRWLADLPAVTIEQCIQVRQTEAQLFRDVNDNATALSII